MKDEFSSLLQKKMDRRDFLKHVGVAFVALTGATTIVKALSGVNPPARTAAAGYGASTYGGNAKRATKTTS